MSIIQPSKRLTLDKSYDRPEKTITESIQNKKDIEEQLKNFEELSPEDVNYVNINTQLKYLTYDREKKRELFRFGGLLVKNAKEYVVLAGKEGKRFSVQKYTRNSKNEIVHTTRFFKRIKAEDLLKSQLDETVVHSSEIIQKQSDIIDKQNQELLALKKKLNKMNS